jgi:hypothetical protein
MSKFITLLVLSALLCSVSYAGIEEDMAAAHASFAAGQMSTARSQYEAIKAAYPDGEQTMLLEADYRMVWIDFIESDHTIEDRVAFADATVAAATNYLPLARANTLIRKTADLFGLVPQRLTQLDRAIELCTNRLKYDAVIHKALYLIRTGSRVEALALLKSLDPQVTDAGSAFTAARLLMTWDAENADDYVLTIATSGNSDMIMRVLDNVLNIQKNLSPEGMLAFLQRALMVVPATEENAEVLGRIKSQLEVLK